jgi:hypothetical protein
MKKPVELFSGRCLWTNSKNANRLSFIALPYAYRENRYLRHYLATRRLLASEITKADYLIFSRHEKYDWSTLAAHLTIKQKRKYDMESDHDHASAQRFHLATMPLGFNKLRKTVWAHSFIKAVENCFSQSSLALFNGAITGIGQNANYPSAQTGDVGYSSEVFLDVIRQTQRKCNNRQSRIERAPGGEYRAAGHV